MHDVAHVRRRGDLALVISAVPKLRILKLKHPVVRVGVVDSLEPLVVRVRVTTDGEQVDVPVSDPGNLYRRLQMENTLGVNHSVDSNINYEHSGSKQIQWKQRKRRAKW